MPGSSACVCVRAPLGRVGLAGLPGAFWCASPFAVAVLAAVFVCVVLSGLGLPCLWLFLGFFFFCAPPFSLAFRVFRPLVPWALAPCGPPPLFCFFPLFCFSPPLSVFFSCLFFFPLFGFFFCFFLFSFFLRRPPGHPTPTGSQGPAPTSPPATHGTAGARPPNATALHIPRVHRRPERGTPARGARPRPRRHAPTAPP